MKKVRKAIFPAAGMGTRFLPATKTTPKEMLPVVDKPLIQYCLEEAIDAGIEEIIMVTARGKGIIEDHFDHAPGLEETLRNKGKTQFLKSINDFLQPPGKVKYVRQMQALGLGHAVWCARDFIGDEPFAVMSPDDLILSDVPCMKQLVDAYEQTGGNIMAVMDVPREQTHRYGILDVADADKEKKIIPVQGMVEKPDPEDAPSTLSIIGRYILTPDVLHQLSHQEKGTGNEIQLTDAMASLIGTQAFHGLRFEGKRFDCGSKTGWLEANIAFALADEERREVTLEMLKHYATMHKQLKS